MSKNANTENFPVASLLLAPEVRKQVLDFYALARHGDDIADSPELEKEEKHRQLNALEGRNPFLDQLLIAFHRDVDQNRYDNWEELILYCGFSAMPVGRFLLDVHGETRGMEASDQLCSALQILNHLQDCQKDFQKLNRIYLPRSFLAQGHSFEELLSKDQASPELRDVLDKCLNKCQKQLENSVSLARLVQNKRLRYQAKVTILCGFALLGKLRRQDPLARRVELSKQDKLLIAYKGFYPL